MGEPGKGHALPSLPEHIGQTRTTRGTETSKYPEEQKSTEIPLVVASERGSAQTDASVSLTALPHPGLWDHIFHGRQTMDAVIKHAHSRRAWNGPPQRVISPVREMPMPADVAPE